jgi:hypothetical protein
VSETRKLAAILVSDIVGYSRLLEPTRTEFWRGCVRSEATSFDKRIEFRIGIHLGATWSKKRTATAGARHCGLRDAAWAER